MRKILWFVFLVIISACSNEESPTELSIDSEIDRLWQETVSIYIIENLWESTHSYDSVNALMLPLRYAHSIANENDSKLQELEDLFYRFSLAYDDNTESNRLRRAYLNYFFLHNVKSKLKHGLPIYDYDITLLEKILDVTNYHWSEEWVGNFAPSPRSFDGIKERLIWKASQHSTELNYYRAFVDEEILLLASGAVYQYILLHNITGLKDELLVKMKNVSDDIVDTGKFLFEKESYFSEQGYWTLQPGVFSDFPDYEYAGHAKLDEGLEKSLVPGIWVDSSHLHRMHVFLKDYQDISSGENRDFFTKALAGLTLNFDEQILVDSSFDFNGLRMHNYSDGYNGVYRYSYATTPSGYGPYQLSGTLFMGWYGLLNSEKLNHGYKRMLLESFPISSEVLKTYVGPNTTRERLELVTWPNYFENGFAELQVYLSVVMYNNGK